MTDVNDHLRWARQRILGAEISEHRLECGNDLPQQDERDEDGELPLREKRNWEGGFGGGWGGPFGGMGGMGGGMGGAISSDFNSQKLIVDYIRVYELR